MRAELKNVFFKKVEQSNSQIGSIYYVFQIITILHGLCLSVKIRTHFLTIATESRSPVKTLCRLDGLFDTAGSGVLPSDP